MKSINNYIQERLTTNKDKIFKYIPNNRRELINIIKEHFDEGIYDLNDIDVSKVTNMCNLFGDYYINDFTDYKIDPEKFDVSEWDVSNVKDFSYMFNSCYWFNCDISNWNVKSGVTFEGMFDGCKVFNHPFELPAKDLSRFAERCYRRMFFNCEALKVAPELPATRLCNECYKMMFWGCKSLVEAPELPALRLNKDCYYAMFMDCKNLKLVAIRYRQTNLSNYTAHWLDNISTEGTILLDINLKPFIDKFGSQNLVPYLWKIEYM